MQLIEASKHNIGFNEVVVVVGFVVFDAAFSAVVEAALDVSIFKINFIYFKKM